MSPLAAQLRRARTWPALLAVAVALVVLVVKATGLVVLAGLLLAERLVAVVLVVVAWADERASGRAGVAPLAATAASTVGRS